jgi:hypothetical protein
MMKFSQMLTEINNNARPTALVASLPRNDPALAKAALEGGADVVKLHLNLHHRASGTKIGSLEDELPALQEILDLWQGKPVGIVPGTRETVNPAEMAQLAPLGFDFLSLYFYDAPVGALPPSNQIERMLAFSSADSPDLAETLEQLDVQVCELSIMAPDTYGQVLTQHDLARYAAFRQRTRLPLVVPSQHRIPPAALTEITRLGIEAVMLGSIVCGNTPESWKAAFQKFSQARLGTDS